MGERLRAVRESAFDRNPAVKLVRKAARREARRAAKHLRRAASLWFVAYTPQAGDVIVDIGAGQAAEVLAFSRAVGASGRVIAIEAHPDTFHNLLDFCARHELHNVTAVNCACVDEAGALQIETLANWQ